MLSQFFQPAPKDDIDQANMLADENLAAAKRALNQVNKTHILGAQTLNTLAQQEDIIDQINDALATVEIQADEGKKHIRGIRSICGGVWNSFKKNFSCCISTPEDKIEKEHKKNKKISAPKNSKKNSIRIPKPQKLKTWRRPSRSLSGKTEKFSKKAEEIDSVVSEIDETLYHMQHQAINMGQVLDRQNKKLDKATQRADKGRKKIHNNHIKMKM